MRVFVTGATGFVGAAVVKELIGAGHQVLGLARSDAGAVALKAAGAEVHRGDLEALDTLRAGAAGADGVVHTAFIHDWSRFQESCEIDRRAIGALGEALAGTDRPLIVTSGTARLAPGGVATEETPASAGEAMPRVSEAAGFATVEAGVRAMAIRLAPSVHDAGDHGFVPMLINLAREKGVSAYIGEGLNRWSAVHRPDAARVYRLALEHGQGGRRYHAIGEGAIAFKDIAAAISRGLNVPLVSLSEAEAPSHFGFFALFAGMDAEASSAVTQAALGWRPAGPGLIADMEANYFHG